MKQRSMERVEYDAFEVDGKIKRPEFAEDCKECEGSGEVHSHNPKCYDCCGFGWVLPESRRLHRDTMEALEQIDAAIFSSDSLENAPTYSVMKHYIDRWQRSLTALQEELHDADEGGHSVRCFVCGADVGMPCMTKNGTMGMLQTHRTRRSDD